MAGHVVIFAGGSRGDIQPCSALGRALADRGHTVRLIASGVYAPLAAGLEFAPLSVDPAHVLQTDEGQAWLAGGRNPLRFVAGFKRILGPIVERILAETLDACAGADLILYPTLGFVGHHIAEHLGIAEALIHFQPSRTTRAFPHPLMRHAFGANRLSFGAVDQLGWQLLRPFVNPWRREVLGLPKLPLRGPMHRVRDVPVLCCFSEVVVPRPADWPSNVHLTGYWFLDEPAWTPSAALAEFLAGGPPPVYVGFGSMVPRDPEEMLRVVRSALCRAGLRGVVTGGAWRETGTLTNAAATGDDALFLIEDVPHSWLFPRVAAVVHHGGAGTTAAGLRAGTPTVVCPFFGDQLFWGERVAALGAGPPPLPVKGLDARTLAARVSAAVGDPGIRTRAAVAGRRIRAEDGIGRACAILESMT
jgi:UDP:flavonoid glycosyltransferase YjiC (YdhE family)